MLKTQWGLCLLYGMFVPGKKTSTKNCFPSSGGDQTPSQLNFPDLAAQNVSRPQPPDRAGKGVAAGFVIAHYYLCFLGLLVLSWRSFAVTQQRILRSSSSRSAG